MKDFSVSPLVKVAASFLLALVIVSDLSDARDSEVGPAAFTVLLLSYASLSAYFYNAQIAALLTVCTMILAFLLDQNGFVILAIFVQAIVVAFLARPLERLIYYLLSLIWVTNSLASAGNLDLGSWMALSLCVTALTSLGWVGQWIWFLKTQSSTRVGELEAEMGKIRERERRALAVELHDVVAHELTVIAMQASAAKFFSGDEKASEEIAIIDRSARSALNELRTMLNVLHEDQVSADNFHNIEPSLSLSESVHKLDREMSSLNYNVAFSYDIPAEESLSLTVRRTVSRILQETCTNLVKHADPVQESSVSLLIEREELVLLSTNYPKGSPSTDGQPSVGGYGLVGIEERVKLLGGYFLSGIQGKRWVVEVRFPISKTTNGRPVDPTDVVSM